MIARVWRGATLAARAGDYADYLAHTGLADIRAAAGHRGVWLLRRLRGDRAEFVLVSLWDSLASSHRFAGHETDRAAYYPEDEDYLIDPEPEKKD